MKNKSYLYIVPHKTFFSNVPAGRVTHAIGIINGLSEHSSNVTIMCEKGIKNHLNRINKNIEILIIEVKANDSNSFFLKSLFSSLKKQIKKTKPECIIVRHQFSFSFFLIVNKIKYKIFRQQKFMVEINGFGFDVSTGISKLLSFFTLYLYKLSILSYEYIYAVNQSISKKLLSFPSIISKSRVIVIENGGPSKATINMPKYHNEIGYVFYGAFQGYVGFKHLIKAFKSQFNQTSKGYLHIVGFGPEKEIIEKMSENDSRIIIEDGKTLPELKIYIESLNYPVIALMPMKINYGNSILKPIKAFEYMSLGIGFIYADCIMSDILEHKKHGLKYLVGSADSLFEQMFFAQKNYDKIKEFNLNIKNLYNGMTWEDRMKELILFIDKNERR